MQSTPKMGMLERFVSITLYDVDEFFDVINRHILKGYRVVHIHRKKMGWWIFGYDAYIVILMKPRLSKTRLKLSIGPVSNRPLPQLKMDIGVVSDR